MVHTDRQRQDATPDVAPAAPAAPAAVRAARTQPDRILGLQRSAGNRATVAVVARQVAAAEATRLRRGSRGPEVMVLQARLNRVDEVETPLEVDGIFGAITAQAVREFREARNLGPGAVADAGVHAELAAAIAEPQDPDEIARKLFLLGAAAYARQQFQHAYDFFTRSQELSDRPALLFSRAQALRRMGGRREEAIALFEAYLASGHGARDADAREHIATLRGPVPTGDPAVDERRARDTFMQGARAYEQRRYAVAADAFGDAHVLADRPALLFSQAQALRRQGGHAEEAAELYETYAASGGERAAEARAFAEALRSQGAVP